MQHAPHDEAPVSLLYVEDDPKARETLKDLISTTYPFWTIHAAANGREGLALFNRHRPDIVLTDLSMPEKDGIEMAREIRILNPKAMIILITAHSDAGHLIEAIRIGINRYVLKPVDCDQLMEAIDDCAARAVMERRIQAQNRHILKLSMAVEQSPCTVVITDAQGAIEYVNPKFTELTGYSSEEAIGQNPRILKSDSTPPGTYREMWATINAGEEWHGEFLNRKKNGELYWETASISPLLKEEGVITHFVGVKHDITERKRMLEAIETLNASLAARAAELETSNKELAAFNYTVSHDLRGPLASIHGFCQLLLEPRHSELDQQSREFVEDIFKQAQRMEQLIKTLMNFSRLGQYELNRQVVDLGMMAQATAEDLRLREPGRRVSFIIDRSVSADGDPRLLRVVLENLVGNAWKYTTKREDAVIEFGELKCEGDPYFFVRDNGAGFDDSQADKLFVPFQRLHEVTEFEGTGIGLATVQRIIARHGGRVWAEAQVGKGATFYFTLQ